MDIYIYIYTHTHTHTYRCIKEYFSAIGMKGVIQFATIWMDLEGYSK